MVRWTKIHVAAPARRLLAGAMFVGTAALFFLPSIPAHRAEVAALQLQQETGPGDSPASAKARP